MNTSSEKQRPVFEVEASVEIIVGPHAGTIAIVRKIEMMNNMQGWITVELPDGSQAMYAGEELRRYR